MMTFLVCRQRERRTKHKIASITIKAQSLFMQFPVTTQTPHVSPFECFYAFSHCAALSGSRWRFLLSYPSRMMRFRLMSVFSVFVSLAWMRNGHPNETRTHTSVDLPYFLTRSGDCHKDELWTSNTLTPGQSISGTIRVLGTMKVRQKKSRMVRTNFLGCNITSGNPKVNPTSTLHSKCSKCNFQN